MSAFTSRSKHRMVKAACIAVLGLSGMAHAADTVQDFSATFPPPPPADRFALRGAANILATGFDGKGLELTPDLPGLSGGAAFTNALPAWTSAIQIDMDFRISDKDNGADGFSIALMNATNFPTGVPTFSEDPALVNSVGIGFDTWNNDNDAITGDDGVPGNGTLPNTISIHYNNSPVAPGVIVQNPATSTPIPDFLEQGKVQHATIRIVPNLANDGSLVSVFITDPDPTIGFTTPYTDFNVPGLLPYSGRIGFAARTGGENSQHLVDNLTVTIDDNPTAALFEDFEAPLSPPPPPPVLLGGSPFVAEKRTPGNSNPAGVLFPVNGDGSDGNGAWRVTTEINNQHNTIAFDTTSEGGSLGIVANASLRFRSTPADPSRADGGSFMLLNTAVYGDTGASVPYDVAEGPNAAGVFAIGFDTFEDGGAEEPQDTDGNVGNHTSIHWNGAEVAGSYNLIPIDEFNLVGNDFRQLTVVLTPGVGGTFVDAILGDRTLYNAFFVPGLDITTTEFRAAFAGRTGGAQDNMEIDNVNISFVPVPEPTSLGLLGLVGAGMCLRRRRA